MSPQPPLIDQGLAELVPPKTEAPVLSVVEEWRLYEYRVVTSTNLIAAGLPAWTAVRADVQTGGRGRFQRTWVSDLGGVWLTAVVPLSKDPLCRRALPLAAGLAICEVLRELGIAGMRLRWPNDVLVQDRKLAGLLIDQFVPGLAVVGIGINVHNEPQKADRSVAKTATRLADLIPAPPNPRELAALILRHLRLVLSDFDQQGAAVLFHRVNELWIGPRRVELDLDGVTRQGLFKGVDETGRLMLAHGEGDLSFYDAHQVRHLTEIESK